MENIGNDDYETRVIEGEPLFMQYIKKEQSSIVLSKKAAIMDDLVDRMSAEYPKVGEVYSRIAAACRTRIKEILKQQHERRTAIQ